MNRRQLAALAVTGVFALTHNAFARMTDSAALTNTFSVKPVTATASLTEPSWDPDEALKTVPGSVIAKDPQIRNTSGEGIWELAAMRIEFAYSDTCPDEEKRGKTLSTGDMQSVLAAYSIDYDADRQQDEPVWRRYDGEDSSLPVQHFYYRQALDRDEATRPLFTRILAPLETADAAFEKIRELGGFQLIVEGAVLAAGDSSPDAAGNAYRQGSFVFPSEST